jgi:hypothetical protein
MSNIIFIKNDFLDILLEKSYYDTIMNQGESFMGKHLKTDELKSDITRFMREFKLSKTSFGLKAVRNPHVISQFLEGKRDLKLATVDAIYAFMEDHRKEFRG